MRAWWVLVVLACSSTPSVVPEPPDPAVTIAPPAAPDAGPAPVSPTPPDDDAEPPPEEDLVAKLPKQDFVPALRAGAPADKQKAASALNTAGLARYRQKDYVGAEAKYVEALAIDPGHALARYNLACSYALTNRADQGLALLAELARAKDCPSCWAAVQLARGDDDWQARWGTVVLWQILALEHTVDIGAPPLPPEEDKPVELRHDAPAPDVKCPAGTTKRRTGSEAYCVRGRVKHGPYEQVEWGMHSGDRRSTSGHYRNGKQHGAWRHGDEFGNGYDGHYFDGKRHGLWVDHGRHQGDHHKTVRSAWIRGKQHNLEQAHVWSRLVEEKLFAGGVAHGLHRAWHLEPYYLEREEHWDRGTPIGRWVEYDGPTRISKISTHDAGTVHGEVVTFVAGDKRRVEHFDHGVRHGVFEVWHQGKRLAQTTLDHDSGDWFEYEDDKLLAKGPLAKGKRVGVWLALDEDKHWLEATYAGGVREGPATLWAEADRKTKFAEGPYVKDKQHGPWIHWMHIHGKIVKSMEGRYVRGDREGKWTFWHDNAAVLATGSYVAGEAHGAWVLYDDTGGVAQRLAIAIGTLKKVDGREPTDREHEAFAREDAFHWSPRILRP